VNDVSEATQFWSSISEQVGLRKKAIYLVAAVAAMALAVLVLTAPMSGYLPWDLHTFFLFSSTILCFLCFGALLIRYKVVQIRNALGPTAPLDRHFFVFFSLWVCVLTMFTLLIPVIMFFGARG